MRANVERIEILAKRILEEARKAADAPPVRHLLDRIPGGRIVRTMIGRTESLTVEVEPPPIPPAPPGAVEATLVVPLAERSPADPQPAGKTPPRAGRPWTAEPPVRSDTPVRMLTGAFAGWTGVARWSPAKGAYNVLLTGPDGQRTRTTLTPSRQGSSWEVVTVAGPRARVPARNSKEA